MCFVKVLWLGCIFEKTINLKEIYFLIGLKIDLQIIKDVISVT